MTRPLLILSLLALAVGSASAQPFVIVDGQAVGGFAYGPAIIRDGDTWHLWTCSAGDNTDPVSWDWLRYATSPDGRTWSAPTVVLRPSPGERSTCDPAVVRGNAGGGEFWWLFYSDNRPGVQTVISVARATNPTGPFAKFDVLEWPFNAAQDGSNIYGRGQSAVVILDGTLYHWFSDDGLATQPHLYLRTWRAGQWGPIRQTTCPCGSVDVKHDPARGRFFMVDIDGDHTAEARLVARTSADGLAWSEPVALADVPWANNVGVSGDDRGHLLPGPTLVAYGSPSRPGCGLCWAEWDLVGVFIDLGELQ